ncbi:MAG: hypothetical protein JNM07_06490 [Phycisphaerae bacterium]|nr:hypothetical protein [Phycisphaerae bacterium]
MIAAIAIMIALLGAAVVWPFSLALLRSWTSPGSLSDQVVWWPRAELIARTLAYPAGIASLAVALGLPAAWAMRASPGARGHWVQVACLAPVFLPSYLSYSALNLARSPGNVFGDLLESAPDWVPMLTGRIIAGASLSIWAWPLVAWLLAPGCRSIPGSVLDAALLESPSRFARARLVVGMLWRAGSLGRAWLGVYLLMLGSAVPLHLAQVDTLAIHLWRVLDLAPEPVNALIAGWPLVLAAGAGAWALSCRFERTWEHEDAADARSPGSPVLAAVGSLAVLSALMPIALSAASLRRWESVGAFWVLLGPAVWGSVRTAALAGLGGTMLCAAFWFGSAGSERVSWAVRAGLGMLAFAALLPGVMIGSFTLGAWRGSGYEDSVLPLALAHVARFGLIGALSGMALSRAESRAQRELRRAEGADTLSGLLRTSWRAALPVMLAAGMATVLLSVQEIEAAVMLQPPGAPLLAQRLLEQLHFARDEELAAATVNLGSLGFVVALAVAIVLARFLRPVRR